MSIAENSFLFIKENRFLRIRRIKSRAIYTYIIPKYLRCMLIEIDHYLMIFSDIDECVKHDGICGDRRCVNTRGSYRCIKICRQGFQARRNKCIGKHCIVFLFQLLLCWEHSG